MNLDVLPGEEDNVGELESGEISLPELLVVLENKFFQNEPLRGDVVMAVCAGICKFEIPGGVEGKGEPGIDREAVPTEFAVELIEPFLCTPSSGEDLLLVGGITGGSEKGNSSIDLLTKGSFLASASRVYFRSR